MNIKRLLQLPRGFLVVGFAVALSVAACTAEQVEASSETVQWVKIANVPSSNGVYKFVDRENACYLVAWNGRMDLSCQ